MILAKGVSKNFGAYAAVQDVSLELQTGERCCLVGPTGSGKTTLLRLIAGLEQPDRGKIYLDGQLVSSKKVMVPPHQRKIGMVFQNLAVWPHLTVLQHLSMVMNSGATSRQRNEKSLDILATLGLEEYFNSYPAMLSGGQRQKLAIARMLAGQPKIALCDEPYAHLDPEGKETTRQMVSHWLAANRITFIMVTHDPLEDLSSFHVMGSMRQGTLESWEKLEAGPNLFKLRQPGLRAVKV